MNSLFNLAQVRAVSAFRIRSEGRVASVAARLSRASSPDSRSEGIHPHMIRIDLAKGRPCPGPRMLGVDEY